MDDFDIVMKIVEPIIQYGAIGTICVLSILAVKKLHTSFTSFLTTQLEQQEKTNQKLLETNQELVTTNRKLVDESIVRQIAYTESTDEKLAEIAEELRLQRVHQRTPVG